MKNGILSKGIWILALVLFASTIQFSCSKDDDTNGDTGGNIEGTWNLNKTKGEVIVLGATQSDEDNNPTGTIIFNEDGTGAGIFATVLFNTQLGNLGQFTWTRSGEVTTITDSNGEISTWTDIEVTSNIYTTVWDQTTSTGVDTKITAYFTK